jgi:glucose-1-phosphate thymidylyltransferase
VKAVVLARGLGRRMQASDAGAVLESGQSDAADAGLKAMMPVGSLATTRGWPFSDYILASLADAGFTDVGIVIGPGPDGIRARYERDARPDRMTIAFLIQHEPHGTADAVLAAEAWTDSEPFVVVNADNLYPVDVLRALRELDGPGLPVFAREELIGASNITAERVASFALLTIDEHGHLTGISEKPGADTMEAAGPRAPVSMNCWRFDRHIFDACRDVPQSSRGEFELPEAVALAVRRGVRFVTVRGHGTVLDLSRRSDVAEVSRRLAGREPRW